MLNDVAIREARIEDADALAALLTQLGYPQDATFVVRKLGEL
jgi:N-acetylglutamate synthase-like GNAT family acetyltransferase